MSLLSWNCRGLGNPRAVRDLRQLVKAKRPVLVFVMETKLCNKNVDYLRIKFGFDHVFKVDSVGRSGGLLLMWKEDIRVVIQNYSRRHINAVISMGPGGFEWKFTGFYGHPEVARRKESWALMRHLAIFNPIPWLCVGDFNEIFNFTELKGATNKTRRQMRDFEEVIEDCHLSDLGFIGPKFTWSNGRGGRALTKERLDRALANVEWRSLFPNADVKVLAKISSDHHPVLVKIKEEKWIWQKKGKFKLEEGCCAREDYRKAIHDSWECRRGRADPWNNIIRNLQRCQKVTQVWVKKNLRASEDLIKAKTRELTVVQQEGKEEERSIEESLKKK
jgi:exonuclease III